MPLEIVRENIVHMKTDAVVNAANSSLQAGGGVCGSIFDVAGYDEMKAACDEIGYCETGGAVITKGFKLPARYDIHAVGPVWRDGCHGEEAQLRSCYRASIELAKRYGLESIAFPLISSGIYGYPKPEALSVAVSEISRFLMENDMTVYIVVYDRASFQLSEKLFNSVASYIDDKYVLQRENYPHLSQAAAYRTAGIAPKRRLEDVVGQLDETFSQSLLRLIDEKGKNDVEIYKKANIDRKHFSKIRSNKDYQPTKLTALAFAVALGLSLDETKDLLAKAGYALSHTSKTDIIIEYFIAENNYDIFELNEALFAFDQPMLG